MDPTDQDKISETVLNELDETVAAFGSLKSGSSEVENFLKDISKMVAHEKTHDPHVEAVGILSKKIPKILNFGQEYRDLKIPYDLNRYKHEDPQKATAPSVPLAELVALAELDIDLLKSVIAQGNRAAKEGLIFAANERLSEIARSHWSQSDATLCFELDGYKLNLVVRNTNLFKTENQFSNFGERSDGYKQFIAL